MKAIVATALNQVELRDWPTPEPGAGEVRIRTAVCGICATDFTMIEGCERSHFPAILGHEWSGVVDQLGEGAPLEIDGKHCVAENVLHDGGEVGFEHPGGYGECFVTEAANVHVIPDDFPLTAAALVEPLAVCVRAMRRLRIEDTRNALVFGDGPVGLIMLPFLKRAGVDDVFMVGGRPGRLDLATELGACQTLNYHEAVGDLADAIRRASGAPFSNVIEASGSAAALEASLQLAADCAHVLMLGDYGAARAGFEWSHFLQHELELIGSNASAGAWQEAVRSAASGEIPLERLVSHTVAPEDFTTGLDLAKSRQDDVLKVVIDWRRT